MSIYLLIIIIEIGNCIHSFIPRRGIVVTNQTTENVIFITDDSVDLYNLVVRATVLTKEIELPDRCINFTKQENAPIVASHILRLLLANHFNYQSKRSDPYEDSILYPSTSNKNFTVVKALYPKYTEQPLSASEIIIKLNEGVTRSHPTARKKLLDNNVSTNFRFDCSIHINRKSISMTVSRAVEYIQINIQGPLVDIFSETEINKMISLNMKSTSQNHKSGASVPCGKLMIKASKTNWPIVYAKCAPKSINTKYNIILRFKFKNKLDCERTNLLYFTLIPPKSNSRKRRQALILAGGAMLGWETFNFFHGESTSHKLDTREFDKRGKTT